jgi:TatD DNase family protein
MPEYLPITGRFLADMLGKDHEEVAATVWENSCRFFGIKA